MLDFAGDLEWGGGPQKVLLLHGFSGGPSDLRYLGERLASEGFHCLAPALPGHGKDLSGLAVASAEDWQMAAATALRRLRGAGEGRVHLVGFSLGGALAIHLAAKSPGEITSLALLAPALRLIGSARLYRRLFRLPMTSRLIPSVAKGPPDLINPGALPVLRGADRLPTQGAHLLDGTIRAAWENLPGVVCPSAVFWGAKDRVVPRSAAEDAAAGVGSGPAPLTILPSSGHHLALDVERAPLAEEVSRFFFARKASILSA